MKIHGYARYLLAIALVASLSEASEVQAQAMADYTSVPPFISDTVAPNVLLVFDNSASMNDPAQSTAFTNATIYPGIFEATECYLYNGLAKVFVPNPAADPATPGACSTSPYHWSGNLLNYATMRRIDIAKWAMIGGNCADARDALDRCPLRVEGQVSAVRTETLSVPKSLADPLMDSSLITGIPGLGGQVRFHLPSGSGYAGHFCIDDDVTASSSACTDGDAFGESGPFKIRLQVPSPATGIVHQVADQVRLGLMKYSTFGSQNGAMVVADIGSDRATLVTTIQGIDAPGGAGTPLAESLYEGIRYIAQLTPAYDSGHYVTGVNTQDPYYFNSPQWASTAQFVACCKSFVIMFTDGLTTKDTSSFPANLDDFAHAIHGTHCTGTGCAGHQTDYGTGSHYLDDVAYFGHIADLRNGTVSATNTLGSTVSLGAGNNLAGTQNVTVYTFFAFGGNSELLQTAAKAGGFNDLNGNNLPDLPEEWDKVNNADGSTGSTVAGCNADCIPDTYFESGDGSTIRDRLMATITSILQQSASGSAASVLASSSTGEGALYQAVFFPATFEGTRRVDWTGHTQGLFLDAFGNLREDTDGDDKLVYENDYIIQSRFDTGLNEVVLDRFVDANGDGQADSGTPTSTVPIKQGKSIWEAGNRLALTASCNRKILTWVDLDNDKVVDGGEQIPFEAACGPKGQDKTSTLAPYLRPGAAPFTAANIINFVRGDQISGMRDRQLTVGGSLEVWKLGDAIHAQPIVVGAPAQRYDVIYGDSSYTAFFSQYRNRRRVTYVGANDGMLHAFNAGYYHRGDDFSTSGVTEHGWFTRTPTDNSSGPQLGDELWGFIPQELLPHLKWLTDPGYTHVYYVDLKPKVTDVRIFTPDADHPNGWGTILMGGFRMGGSCGNCTAGTGAPPMTVNADFNNDGDTVDPGDTRTFYSGYFVLDITNPEKDPVLLWSFSSSDLGLTTTVPSMLRVSPSSSAITDNTDAKWYMIVGSGPTGYDGDTGQTSKLYAIDLAQGPGANNSLVTTMPVGTYDSFMADTVTIDRNFDYRVDVSYEGRLIHDGSLPWRGKLYRLTMNTCAATPCSTSTWGISDGGGNRTPTEILDTFPASNTLELGPITAAPAVALDDSNKLWVFAGTGRYFGAVDKTNTEQQYFVGVKDSVMNGLCTESSTTNCHDNDLVDVSAAQVCVLGTGTCGTSTDQVTGVSGATDFPSLIGLVASKDGWYTTLPTSGERSLARPVVVGGIAFFPTFTPTNDPCAATGDSNLYALHYLTGSASPTPVIGTTTSGSNQISNRSTGLGKGLVSEVVVQLGKGSTQGSARAFVQKSTGEITSVETKNLGPVVSRFMSWYRQVD